MPLPDAYLAYPNRRHGQDIDRYAWRLSIDRPKVNWPGGAAVAAMIVIPLEFFPLTPSGKPFKHPGAMVTPYPDLRHYTTRDYGNRVGIYRLLKALKAAGLTATLAVNARVLERYPGLVADCAADGHEIAAHGYDTDTIAWGGGDAGAEQAAVERTRAVFAAHGYAPRAWLSPARQQSFATPDVIRAAGFDVCLDWESDGVPMPMRTDAGALTCVPLLNELDDRLILSDKRHAEDVWARQILEAKDFLASEQPRFGGQVLGFTLTPYLAGLPFRMQAVRTILAGLAQDTAVWSAGASAIANAAAR
jgi:allantoinase